MLAPTGPFFSYVTMSCKAQDDSIYELEVFDRDAIWCRVYNDK